jgi:hypothetical protein
MRRTLLVAVLVLTACGPAPVHGTVARVPTTSTSSFADDDADDEEDVTCKEERMTGTNLSRPVCRTQAEIDEERNAAMMWEKHPRNHTSGVEQ